ncbi:xanthine and CO dehydrogenases maturation factor, XdhC/CoxF family [Pseudomonas asplenii]|uniref:Xanthine and CO dehydrogenases maturation factor, XdhC/CoxF family n=1 Tax=Pseudomonas asplenii TaxID=53407 RepID=A0A0M9GCD4_9PSED|nr:XdhC family protein [Pseudomonas fuscovaginae]KPA87705.1 xanthine and CO dehydrogenases maturation factor, XdhC/CoxF family [Pseudomonas fuscovaginae]
MQHLDVTVLEQALAWADEGKSVWLCTVLSTFGSAPRSPGAMLVAIRSGAHSGSLSGGCVEEEFIEALGRGEHRAPAQVVSYGRTPEERSRLQLPCGGSLDVLVEHRQASVEWRAHLRQLLDALRGQRRLTRVIELESGQFSIKRHLDGAQAVIWAGNRLELNLGPALRLLLAGLSPVAQACGQFARALGFEVIACDPREEAAVLAIEGIALIPMLPSVYIANGGCHEATAVVALTHDPRIDDLALMEAVHTPAFYIGAMGSRRTSEKRAERLQRIGRLSASDIERLHMPIGLDIGSRTPAEIALSVMADVLRVYRGKARTAL